MHARKCHVLIVLPAVFAILLTGCGREESMPLTPALPSAIQQSVEASSATVTSSGATLGVGGALLVIPPGALTAPLQVTIKTETVAGARQWSVLPADFHTEAACTLRLPLPGAVLDGAQVRVLGWSQDEEAWRDLGGVCDGQVVTTQTVDFTRYQIDIIN